MILLENAQFILIVLGIFGALSYLFGGGKS